MTPSKAKSKRKSTRDVGTVSFVKALRRVPDADLREIAIGALAVTADVMAEVRRRNLLQK